MDQPEPKTPWSDRHPDKEVLRQQIWTQMQAQGIAKRDPFGHIPNFIGAEAAAAILATLPIWQTAQVIKCNPDTPQRAVRLRALQDGKTLYMAVPQLSRKKCFVELTAAALAAQGKRPQDAATMRGALSYGKAVAFEDMQPIDLVMVGCVAVASGGGRTGKGAGFADLELAMLSKFGLVQPTTPIVTTVHGVQIVADEALPMQPHDWPLDWIVTPEAAIATQTAFPQPTGLDWSTIQPDQLNTIPILRDLQARPPGSSGQDGVGMAGYPSLEPESQRDSHDSY